MYERLSTERQQLLEHLQQLSNIIAKSDTEIAHLKAANEATALREMAKRKEVDMAEGRAIFHSRRAQKVSEDVRGDETIQVAYLKARDLYGELDDARAAYQLVADDAGSIAEGRNDEVLKVTEYKGRLLQKKDWVIAQLISYDGMLAQLDADGRFLRQPSFVNPVTVHERQWIGCHANSPWRWVHEPNSTADVRDAKMRYVSAPNEHLVAVHERQLVDSPTDSPWRAADLPNPRSGARDVKMKEASPAKEQHSRAWWESIPKSTGVVADPEVIDIS